MANFEGSSFIGGTYHFGDEVRGFASKFYGFMWLVTYLHFRLLKFTLIVWNHSWRITQPAGSTTNVVYNMVCNGYELLFVGSWDNNW